MELKKFKNNIEAESRMEVTEGREAGDIGRCWPKGTKSWLYKVNIQRSTAQHDDCGY